MTEPVPGNVSFPFPHHFRPPGRQMKLWTEKLSEVEHKRTKYQEMAASDLITFDELRSRLSELEETRRTAERELATLRNHQEHVWRWSKIGTPC
jgi:hypothetical protein